VLRTSTRGLTFSEFSTKVNRALQQVGTMLKTLDALPPHERDFFARRIVRHIQDKAYLPDDPLPPRDCGI
jgi:hypothetical protein